MFMTDRVLLACSGDALWRAENMGIFPGEFFEAVHAGTDWPYTKISPTRTLRACVLRKECRSSSFSSFPEVQEFG